MQIKIHKYFDYKLKQEWEKLENSSSNVHVFQTFEWNHHWYKEVGKSCKSDLNIAVVSVNENPLIIFPLWIYLNKTVKILSFIGERQHDYFSSLNANSIEQNNIDIINIWKNVYNALPKHDIINIYGIPEFFPNGTFNPLLQVEKFFTFNLSHYLELPKDVNCFLKNSRKKLISDLQRQIRRFHELGNLEFLIIKDKNLYKEYLSILIHQKRNQFKSTSVYDSLSRVIVQNFYFNFPDNDKLKDLYHFSVLKLNNRVIACHWGIVYKKTFYYLLPSYDKDYAKYSPGKILTFNLIKWSIEKNLDIFDFTIGSEDYKKEWVNKTINLYQYFRSLTLKGYIYKLYLLSVNHIKGKKSWAFFRTIYRTYKNIIDE
jgi:CelD/BcsL family acetyltransferase involved in cellulose biosynthesis